jgi:hypothetical protein
LENTRKARRKRRKPDCPETDSPLSCLKASPGWFPQADRVLFS